MSTDGTQPPSIAPKKPPAARPTRPGTVTRAVEGRSGDTSPRGTRPVKPPLSGGTAPSVGERIKRTAQTVADAARPRSTAAGGLQDAESGSTATSVGASVGTGLPTTTLPSTTLPGTPMPPMSTPTAGIDRTPSLSPARASSSRNSLSSTSVSSSSSSGGPRKVRLAIARVDPWSVMKLSFLLSVAIGIMVVVAAAVVWYTLDGLGVFTSVNSTIAEITGDPNFFNLLEYAAFKRVISLATMIAVVDVVILTALATIGAFLYNIVAALVGGINLTLTDD
jgi:hypothetical protein